MYNSSTNPYRRNSSESTIEIKISDLFTDNNPSGVFSKAEYRDYKSGMTEYQLNKFALFFEYLSAGYQITSLPLPTGTNTSEQTLWVKFKTPTGEQPFPMPYTIGLLKLVKYYISGVFKGVLFPIEQIDEEANK